LETADKHRATHSREEYESNFVCPKCYRVSKDAENFEEHKKIGNCLYADIRARGFACKYCGKPCGDKHKRITHHRIHTGERPFRCTICQMSFNTKPNWKRHSLKQHSKDVDEK